MGGNATHPGLEDGGRPLLEDLDEVGRDARSVCDDLEDVFAEPVIAHELGKK